MHDKFGQPLSVGDFVKVETYREGKPDTVVAQITTANPGAETCNVQVAVPYRTWAVREEWATASKVEKVHL